MVDITISSSRVGDAKIIRQGLSTGLASLQSCLEGCSCHTEHHYTLDEQAISVTAVEPIKAIAAVPVSRLAIPFSLSNASHRRKKTPPPPPPHRGFVRVPSPLAAGEESSRRKAQPHSRPAPYRHHQHNGHSRQALLQTKWLWSTREEHWHNHKSANPETVPPQVSATSAGLRNLKVQSHCVRPMRPSFDCQDVQSSEAPLTIFPRRGDIAALRDSYCVEADRCFANVPIWTLAKVLWVHDMHALSAPKAPEPEADEDPFDETASEASYDPSIGFSDDSESTLVDSETEWDSSNDDVDESCNLKGRRAGVPSLSPGTSSGVPSQAQPDPVSPLAWAKDVYLKTPRTPQPSLPSSLNGRWDVLLELSHTERCPEKSPPTSSKPLPAKTMPMVMPPKPVVPKRLSFTRGFLTGLKKQNASKPERSTPFIVQESFLTSSHPAAG